MSNSRLDKLNKKYTAPPYVNTFRSVRVPILLLLLRQQVAKYAWKTLISPDRRQVLHIDHSSLLLLLLLPAFDH